ncbi:MAG TPA: adenylyltransferase/cytidyltransferase family protein [Candidatus Saccharimonadales bacterium]|nr:adenylyltransferase/cytidyltransferase family protein [Candidatus Saccharimonadales bacterium]
MNFREKILSWEALKSWRGALRKQRRRLVATNGCFDILHLGHVTYLEAARKEGDALLVAVNSDASVSAIKGPNRPVNNEQDRAAVLSALASVDAVLVFYEPDAMRMLAEVKPDIYAKGGDYTIDTINQDERRLVESQGGKVVVLGGVPGKSTTGLLEKMSRK